MRILTVRQPWAWAIVHGGKNVENRTRNVAGGYRGPVAIHAAETWDFDWSYRGDAISDAVRERRAGSGERWIDMKESLTAGQGTILGIVTLRDVHRGGSDSCAEASPWADAAAWHLVLDDPMPLAHPIAHRGGPGLRRLDAHTISQVLAQMHG